MDVLDWILRLTVGNHPQEKSERDLCSELDNLQRQRAPEHLNWRHSIVDFMKLLGLDSSQEVRQQLAKKLGYTGSVDETAAMNVWLKSRIFEEIRKNGGNIPEDLK